MKDQRFLGTENFVEGVYRNTKEEFPTTYDIEIEEIVSKAGLVLHTDSDLFYSLTRNRKGALGRAIVGYLGRKLCRYKNGTVAKHFKRDSVVISEGIKRIENECRRNKAFAKKIEKIEQSLIRNRKKKYLINEA